MASYSQQPFYSQPSTIYPPTPTSTHQPDDFSPLSFPSYPGYDFNFEPTPNHQNISSSIRGHTPIEHDTQQRTRSSSEEKELTPGQRRRKEQNRAAQRAFRERKERHVKELEHRLKTLEQHASETAAQNDILKQELQKTKLENRLLHENSLRGQSPSELSDVAAMSFKPTDHATVNPPPAFTAPIFGEHPNRGPIHRISTSPKTGERLLGAGAAWDLIVCHPLYEQGLVDIGDISDRLKGMARCDGQGPVFEENVILEAIQSSSGSGRDELLVEPPGLQY
jgi:AP-1-like factor